MGFVIFMLMGAYLVISLGTVAWAVGFAKKSGQRGWLWGLMAAFVMYNLVFWDWIPTVVAHKYYCEKEAGFWVYKTLEQWKVENPGGMKSLVETNNSPQGISPNWPEENWRGKKIASINQRFGILYIDHLSSAEEHDLFLNNWRWKIELLDKSTGEILARRVDFSTGNDGYIGGMHSMKFWLQSEGCISGKEHSREFGEFIKQFRGTK